MHLMMLRWEKCLDSSARSREGEDKISKKIMIIFGTRLEAINSSPMKGTTMLATLAVGCKADADELLEMLEEMKAITENVLERFSKLPTNIIKIDNTGLAG